MSSASSQSPQDDKVPKPPSGPSATTSEAIVPQDGGAAASTQSTMNTDTSPTGAELTNGQTNGHHAAHMHLVGAFGPSSFGMFYHYHPTMQQQNNSANAPSEGPNVPHGTASAPEPAQQHDGNQDTPPFPGPPMPPGMMHLLTSFFPNLPPAGHPDWQNGIGHQQLENTLAEAVDSGPTGIGTGSTGIGNIEDLVDLLFWNVGGPFAGVRLPPCRCHLRFNAIAFVDSLPSVDLSSIPADANKCPHCWTPFGEVDPEFVPDAPETPEAEAALAAVHELPFDISKPDNDPVRTPCGHVFGKGCLLESLEKTGTKCPICRHEFNKRHGR